MHIQLLLYPQPCSNSLKGIRISVNNKQYITVNIRCQLLYAVYFLGENGNLSFINSLNAVVRLCCPGQ